MRERITIRFQMWHILLTVVLLASLAMATISAGSTPQLFQEPTRTVLVAEVDNEPLVGGPAVPAGISEVDNAPLTGGGPVPALNGEPEALEGGRDDSTGVQESSPAP